MTDVRPFCALHYNLAAVHSLADVTAPPYDVIDAERRRTLLARSPFNVVELDLPEAPEGADPYQHAGETLEAWTLEGILTADRDPAIWALTQEYTAPDCSRCTRRGFLARIRLEDYGPGSIRPHERTQPGPKEDRLRLTRATRHNLSPIFVLHPGDVWRHIEPALTESEPWGEVADPDETIHRVWRISDPAVHDALAAELADAELLIADGHHRYETARTYAAEIEGEGAHSYTLACLVSLDDPGLTVFPTHRLLTGLDASGREALDAGLRRLFDLEEVPIENLDPAGEDGTGVFGYIASNAGGGFRLRLREERSLEDTLPRKSAAYRSLDAVILEALVLRGLLGMSEADIAAKRGISYSPSTPETLRRVQAGETDCAFLLRPTPVAQVREVAAAGETMPPKSTYFFPKLLTGFVFNPLS